MSLKQKDNYFEEEYGRKEVLVECPNCFDNYFFETNLEDISWCHRSFTCDGCGASFTVADARVKERPLS